MRKMLAFLVFTLVQSAPTASARTFCSAATAQVADAFTDFNHRLSDDSRAQLNLLSNCAGYHKICVAIGAPGPKWFELVQGDSPAEIARKANRDSHAVAVLTSVSLPDGRGRCVLGRFSGGTALVWTIDAWEVKNGKIRVLNTDQIQLHGETKSPFELQKESERATRNLH